MWETRKDFKTLKGDDPALPDFHALFINAIQLKLRRVSDKSVMLRVSFILLSISLFCYRLFYI